MEKQENLDEIQKPKRTSLILCTIVQTIGWILLIQTTALFIMILTGYQKAIEDRQPAEIIMTLVAYWFALDFIILGASVIILGQLARFIIGQKICPGLILRRSSEILLLFACAAVIWGIYIYQFLKPLLPQDAIAAAFAVTIFAAVAIKTSLLILLSQILKRIVPVIEEYKSLV
ncbi:MAG: hypothetical protein WCZ89_03905 [Phycisphaerae bacterium]